MNTEHWSVRRAKQILEKLKKLPNASDLEYLEVQLIAAELLDVADRAKRQHLERIR